MKSKPTFFLQGRRSTAILLIFFLVIAAFLLFARLGHYALWDDESYTALSAEGVLITGDTSAIIGHNIVAYSGGSVLSNLRDRYSPPLPAYLTAPFLKLLGENAFAARLPFALCGLGCFLLIAWWLWSEKACFLMCCLIVLGSLCNVSFLLYLRQGRYYAVVALCVLLVTYFYYKWKGGIKYALLLSLTLVCLFASNYMTYLVVGGVLAIDYMLWGRKLVRPTPGEWAILIAVQIVFCGAIAWFWNPFTAEIGAARLAGNSLTQRLTLLWWNLRDLNTCEFGALILLFLSPFFCWRRKTDPVLRTFVAFLAFLVLTTLVSPQPVAQTSVADIRYIFPIIPFCIYLQAAVLFRAIKNFFFCLAVALVVFGTNIFNGGAFLGGIHSTPLKFLGELYSPPSDPYTEASQWINTNLLLNDSVLVIPDYAVAPLIFHAPRAVYGWQLDWPPKEQFKDLDPIHFKGRIAPDYILAFGPFAEQVRRMLPDWQGVRYEQIATLEIFWKDVHRPELFWRSFQPIKNFDPSVDGIAVFKRTQ